MNLLELKKQVDNAVKYAEECGEKPDDIIVTLQIDNDTHCIWSDEGVELHYDNNTDTSGCVLTANLLSLSVSDFT